MFGCRALALAFAVLVSFSLPSLAAGPQGEGDNVVATVGEQKVYLSEIVSQVVAEQQKERQKNQQRPFSEVFDEFLEKRIERLLAAQAARAEGMDKEEWHKQRMERVEEQLLGDAYLQQQIVKRVSEDAVKKRYEDVTANLKGQEEVWARHIVVDSEEKANALKARLDAGEDFVELAKSLDYPSAENGGDLGYFRKDQILREIGEAAFATEVGKVAGPIKSPFGWHLIKVEDRRAVEVPSYKKVENQIFRDLSKKARAEVITELRSEVPISLFNRDGSPRPSANGIPIKEVTRSGDDLPAVTDK